MFWTGKNTTGQVK